MRSAIQLCSDYVGQSSKLPHSPLVLRSLRRQRSSTPIAELSAQLLYALSPEDAPGLEAT
jgi:hypothetical protein